MEAGIVSQDTSQPVQSNGNDSGELDQTEASAIQSSLMPPNEADMLTSGNINLLNRRETLSRRPSYRKILNDLSANENNNDKSKENQSQIPIEISDTGNQEHESLDENAQMFNNTGNVMQENNQEMQMQQDVLNPTSMQNNIHSGQGMQEFSIANLSQSQRNLLQQSDINSGNLWPSGQVVVQTPAGMQAYQIQQNYPSTLLLPGQGVTAPMPSVSPQQLAEDASRKRESRLIKNRDAAKECRRRKKEYVKCLETRVAVLEHQNQQLIDELKTLKELYVHKQVDTL